MLQSAGSDFNWYILGVCAGNSDLIEIESDGEFGEWFAQRATEFILNESPHCNGRNNIVVYRPIQSIVNAGPQPVRHWLPGDKWTLWLLKDPSSCAAAAPLKQMPI